MSQGKACKGSAAETVRAIRFESAHRERWNQFVAQSKNATFLSHRDYMEYHADRFQDHSILLFDERKVRAILPANEEGDLISSHSGLTYGGLLLEEDARLEETVRFFTEILEYYRAQGFRRLRYKKLPFYYATRPAFEDCYALTALGGKLAEVRMGFIVDTSRPPRFSQRRVRGARSAERHGCVVSRSRSFREYWETVLLPNLARRGSQPVHSIEEMERLSSLFPEDIVLYECRFEGRMVAGTVVYLCGRTAHAQYIASSARGREISAGDLLFRSLFEQLYARVGTISLGTSHDPATGNLDLGLVEWKESLGSRAVAHEIYEIELVESIRERARSLLNRPSL